MQLRQKKPCSISLMTFSGYRDLGDEAYIPSTASTIELTIASCKLILVLTQLGSCVMCPRTYLCMSSELARISKYKGSWKSKVKLVIWRDVVNRLYP